MKKKSRLPELWYVQIFGKDRNTPNFKSLLKYMKRDGKTIATFRDDYIYYGKISSSSFGGFDVSNEEYYFIGCTKITLDEFISMTEEPPIRCYNNCVNPFTPTVGHVYFMWDEHKRIGGDLVFIGQIKNLYMGCSIDDYEILKNGGVINTLSSWQNIRPSEKRTIKVKEAIEKVAECFDKVGAHKESVLYKTIINNLNDV